MCAAAVAVAQGVALALVFAGQDVTVGELGTLNVQRRDIVSVRRWNATFTRTYKVSGQYASVMKWLDTKIKVRKGQKLKITADGTMHWVRWGNRICTPAMALASARL